MEKRMEKIKPIIELLYYDYPQVFIGRNIEDQNYCCMVITENEFGPQYLCTPISDQRTQRISDGYIDLRDVYEYPEVNYFYLASYNEEDEESISLILQDYTSCPEEFLPNS